MMVRKEDGKAGMPDYKGWTSARPGDCPGFPKEITHSAGKGTKS
jgi:hypothetical protein